jgi:imidazolonepropionase-like amidohydrolase
MFLKWTLGIALSLSICAAGFTLSASAQASGAAGGKRTLVKAGHVLDVKTGKLAEAQTIVVVGDTIQSIVPTASVAPQPGDTVVDLGRLTVLPG